MINKKEFGDWAVVFWEKGSKTLHIAQNQGEPGTTNYWMVGTTARQFDYESGWLPNKDWTSTVKGHFSKDKAVQIAKENAMKKIKESELCSRDAFNKRQREINRENDATLAYSEIDKAMSAEFVKDSFFNETPSSHHWSETVGNLTFICSVDEDNCNKAHFSTYENKERIESKYVSLNGDCVEQFYEYIANRV